MIRLLCVALLGLLFAACGSGGEPVVTETPTLVLTETPRVVSTVANPHGTPSPLTAEQSAQAKQIMSDSSRASGLLHDLINESDRQQDIVFPVVNDANELINVGIVLQLNGPTDVPELQAHGLTRAAVYVDLGTEQVTRITPWPGPVPRPSTDH